MRVTSAEPLNADSSSTKFSDEGTINLACDYMVNKEGKDRRKKISNRFVS